MAHQIRLEKILTAAPSDSFPRCIEGRGSPHSSRCPPVELAHLAALLTLCSVVHHLAELIDRNVADGALAQHLRYLRP